MNKIHIVLFPVCVQWEWQEDLTNDKIMKVLFDR